MAVIKGVEKNKIVWSTKKTFTNGSTIREICTRRKEKRSLSYNERVSTRKVGSIYESFIIFIKWAYIIYPKWITLVEMATNFWLCELTQSQLVSILVQFFYLPPTYCHQYHNFHSSNLEQIVQFSSTWKQGPQK